MELMTGVRRGKGGGADGLWPKRTRSSLIAGLRRGDRKLAMPALCNAYWAPLLN